VDRPLRILMVLHMPWDRNLGGSRPQVEIGEEWTRQGHAVEKFDCLDAFGPPSPSRWHNLCRPPFSKKAIQYVKQNAHRFDVIDAHQGNLPCAKGELGFTGLLVARSVGLYAFYDQYRRLEMTRWPRQSRGNLLGHLGRVFRYQREFPSYRHSLAACDLINVPNQDEKDYVGTVLGFADKCKVFPFGLSPARSSAFAQVRRSPAQRWPNKQVAFVGAWGLRKGAMDWAAIVTRLRKVVPSVRFLFLGTQCSPERVLKDLRQPAGASVQIVPQYDSDDLPQLLADATVGAFPSYMEGFPFGVLEKLAAGLPTVAYDVPGPREMLPRIDSGLLVSAGDTEAFCRVLERLLNMDLSSYTDLSIKCGRVADQFTWPEIAHGTLATYQSWLENNRPSLRRGKPSYSLVP
jgi:glycosyltransferase involved in cell wall biosynthesis